MTVGRTVQPRVDDCARPLVGSCEIGMSAACTGGNKGGRLILKTALCEQLGIEHPIFSVGIGPAATAELAAAVSSAGGCGVLGGGVAGGAYVREQVRRLRALIGRPFGVNIILGDQDQDQDPEPIEAASRSVFRSSCSSGAIRSPMSLTPIGTG